MARRITATEQATGRARKTPPNGASPAKSAAGSSDVRLSVRTVADITAKPVDWLWPGRVPFGMLSILDGDPGLGKSSIALDLAARLTSGRRMPLDDRTAIPPADIMLLCGEDSPEHTIRPRLQAAGADLTRCHLIDGLTVGDDEHPIVFPADLSRIETEVGARSVRFVVVDPLLGFIGGGVDTNSDSSSRKVLNALKRLAERTGVAVLCIRHLNKKDGEPALYRGGGSIAFTAAARSALTVGRHPKESDHLVLASVKLNVGQSPPAITYTIATTNGQPVIHWGAECDLTADDIVTRTVRKPGQPLALATDFLRRELANGPVPAKEMEAAAEEAGITEASLRRAKVKLNVNSRKVGFDDAAGWEWYLPGAETADRASGQPELTPAEQGGPHRPPDEGAHPP